MNTSLNPMAGAAAPAGDPVAWLTKDHLLIREELDKLVAASESSAPLILDRLTSLLALHNAIEENLVYPAIANIAGRRESAMQLYHETAEADILVNSVQRALLAKDTAGFNVHATALRTAILAHVREEETAAFPLLEACPPPEKQLLAQQILSFRQSLVP